MRANIVIQGSESPTDEDGGSPLARYLMGETVDDEARTYELVLPRVEHVLTRVNDYETLWRPAWERIARALESFAKGSSQVEEIGVAKLSVVTLAPEIFGPKGFDPSRHTAPFTAISRHAHGEVFLISTPLDGGWAYRIDYPYYCWAETVVRPRIERRDFAPLVARLNKAEGSANGCWKLDASELTSAVKLCDAVGKPAASTLQPEVVAGEIAGIATQD